MSTPCTTCGKPLDVTARRCPTCGELASPHDEETRTLDDALPWSIPIREPGTGRRDDGPSVAARAGALAVLALVVTAATLLLVSRLFDDGGSGATAGDTDQPERTERAAAQTDATTRTTAAPTTTETTVADTTTTSTAPTTSTTLAPTTTVPTPTTLGVRAARTEPNGTGSVPALSTSFRGWIAQLRSVPYDAGTDALAQEWERTRAAAPGAVAARSNDWSAFGDGFWVLLDPGPFGSADEVRSFCASAGLGGEGSCLARELRG